MKHTLSPFWWATEFYIELIDFSEIKKKKIIKYRHCDKLVLYLSIIKSMQSNHQKCHLQYLIEPKANFILYNKRYFHCTNNQILLNLHSFWSPNPKITIIAVALSRCVCVCYQHNPKTDYYGKSKFLILHL